MHVFSLAWVLLGSCHPVPTLIVSALTGLLSQAMGLGTGATILVILAVLTGQLSIGWSNDVFDADRDAAAGRGDKPLASDHGHRRFVRAAAALALAATIALSLALGARAGLTHLVFGVASGWAYNAWLKATMWSWLPFLLAFGTLPQVVALTAGWLAPAWVSVTAGLLGVAAHAVNVLPDIADDRLTGLRGLGPRLGERGVRLLATAALIAAITTVLLSADLPTGTALATAAAAAGGGVAALFGSGKVPFLALGSLALVVAALMLSYL